MATVIVETDVTEWQGEFHAFVGKTGVVVGGISSGKSFSAAEWLLDRSHEWPISRSGIVSGTFKQAKEGACYTFREKLKDYGYKEDKHWKQNKTDLSITMLGSPLKGHQFTVWYVANNAYKALKSVELDSIWADELQEWQNGEKALTFLYGRNRSSPLALAAYGYRGEDGLPACRMHAQMRCTANPPWTTTHWLHKKFIAKDGYDPAQDDSGATVRVWRVSTFDNYLMANREEFIEQLRRDMPEDVFRIEVLGESGDVGVGRVYTSFFRTRHVATPANTRTSAQILPYIDENGLPELAKNNPLVWAHDFGVDPRAAVIMQYHTLPEPIFGFQREVVYVLDEIRIRDGSTDRMIDAFNDWVREHYGEDELPVEVEFYGDASGDNRNSAVGYSDWGMLKTDPRLAKYHKTWHVPLKNGAIVDRVNAFNHKLLDAAGNVGTIFHPRCGHSIEDVQQTHWLEGTRQLDHGTRSKEIFRTHMSDGIGYFVVRKWPVVFRKPPEMSFAIAKNRR
jgi:hypothetical protein